MSSRELFKLSESISELSNRVDSLQVASAPSCSCKCTQFDEAELMRKIEMLIDQKIAAIPVPVAPAPVPVPVPRSASAKKSASSSSISE